MGTPVQHTKEYDNAMKELTGICRDLASNYSLRVFKTTKTPWNEVYEDEDKKRTRTSFTTIPPSDGPIYFRDGNSQLKATLEVTPEFNGEKMAFTGIERLMLTVLDRKYKGFANDFAKKYDLDPERVLIELLKEKQL